MNRKIAVTLALAEIFCAIALCAESTAESLKTAKAYSNIPIKVIKRVSIPRWYHEGLLCEGQNVWVMNGEGGKTWVIDTSSGKVVSEMRSTASFTEGMTKMPDGTFFVTDWEEKKLYNVKIENDKTIPFSEISLAPGHPAGVVWNGSRLYVITWTRGKFGTKFDLLEMDEKGSLLRKIPIKRIQEPAHMAWDGTNLWITSWYSKMVYKIDLTKLDILGYFDSPVSMATGIAWDGKYFWLTGTYGDLYQLEVMAQSV